MYESVATTCQIISSLSLLGNIYLIYLYFCCPVNNLNSYKHFFLGTALQDLLFSTCIILLSPVTMSKDSAFVFLAYGPLREKNQGQALMLLFCAVFTSSMALVADTFIYRYLQICKPQLFDSLLCRRNVMLGMLCNGLIIAFSLTTVWISFWPNSSFLSLMDDLILLNTGLHGDQLALIGISLKIVGASELTLLASITVIFQVLGVIITYTAYKIQTTIKNAMRSSELRQLHRQMFTLLLLQVRGLFFAFTPAATYPNQETISTAACPFGFLHAPLFVVFIFFFSGLPLNHLVVSLCAILLALFPLFSPIIIVGFLKDYRRHLFVLLRICRTSSDASSISVRPFKTSRS